MSKSEKIRAWVQANAGCSPADIAAGTGLQLKFVNDICSQQRRLGKFTGSAREGWFWNDAYVEGERLVKVGRKVKGNRAVLREKRLTQKNKTLRDVVRKYAGSATAGALNVLTREQRLVWHAHSTFENLKSVLDLEGCDPALVAAWRVHSEAMALLDVSVCPF